LGRRNVESVVSPLNPIKIILKYSDICQICNGKMKMLDLGIWRGKQYGMLHTDCYNKSVNTTLEELLDW
jgi:hypothetical protein